ncbi:uncharacterized protein TNCV_4862421 [Trichonephila clavipes]|nr:uncharacterized protein TNCV_4862421 [Trichonephila clavipes]
MGDPNQLRPVKTNHNVFSVSLDIPITRIDLKESKRFSPEYESIIQQLRYYVDTNDETVPLRHGGTLNSRRAASPLEWLVEREERWEASDQSQSVLPLNWGRTEPNRITCIVLKATANDRRHLTLCHDEFHGPRSGLCNNNNIFSVYGASNESRIVIFQRFLSINTGLTNKRVLRRNIKCQ